jgi:1,4-dihydroxy-2-naphthoyl-CoA hydrolase
MADVGDFSTMAGGLPATMPGFDSVIGFELREVSLERVVGGFTIRPELTQPFGILHGGVLCSVVEAAASVGAAFWLGDRGQVVGVANHTNFLRATRTGQLVVTATPIHRGRSQQLWLVEVTDAQAKAIARGEVRLANLEDAAGLGHR